ncbi:alpha/beta fold hydrolase [Fodinibius halophilus]|uniref:Alpha/beta fold hydrolase n=1 Tax=Fodinibius halophilus TaxID=1736908 RepID=A0A6M1TMA9_9BACT|nr:alpha/beta fold hydrolase [Fodinibius halophilus]NGP89540.1 alpha/beta fold hydrolase [Fodinibius halophilus]
MDIRHRYIALICFLGIALLIPSSLLKGQTVQFSDLDYPYTVKYQQLSSDLRVAYSDIGEGPAVIMIHGLGSYIPAWKKNIEVLKESHRIIAVDLLGFGKSSKSADHYSIPFFAETVAELQDSLGIAKATWMGHSMGAQITLRAALEYPEKISSLVLLAPAGFERFTQQEGQILSSFVTPSSIKATPDSLIRQTFKTTFFDFPAEAEFMIEDRITIRQADHFDGYARAYASSVKAMLEDPVAEELSKVEQPTLIVFGKQDMLIPNRQLHPDLTTQKVARFGHEKIPKSKLKMIPEAGHFVHFEQAGTVNELILNFLNK